MMLKPSSGTQSLFYRKLQNLRLATHTYNTNSEAISNSGLYYFLLPMIGRGFPDADVVASRYVLLANAKSTCVATLNTLYQIIYQHVDLQ